MRDFKDICPECRDLLREWIRYEPSEVRPVEESKVEGFIECFYRCNYNHCWVKWFNPNSQVL